jgi:hypothetical protein
LPHLQTVSPPGWACSLRLAVPIGTAAVVRLERKRAL